MAKFKNTLQKGSVRYIVFKEKRQWYAVALEFNIVEAGDDPREVLLALFEAIQGYVKSAGKINARPHILNQNADIEYESLWAALQGKKQRKDGPQEQMPLVFTFGERQLVAAY